MVSKTISFRHTIRRIIKQSTARLYPFYILFIPVLLYGCATVGVPSGSSAVAIKAGEKTIVMLRVEGKVNGQPVNAVKHFSLKIASIDKNEIPQYTFFLSSPSSDRKREGWIYLLLNPRETYYLSSSFGVEAQSITSFKLMPDMTIHVPNDKQVVYIGSLSVTCEGKVNFFGVPYVSSCELSITDETELAKSVARVPETVLLASRQLPPPSLKQYVPLGIASMSAEGIVGPKWIKRAIYRAVRWSHDEAPIDFFACGTRDAACGYIAVGYIMFYLPPAMTIGAMGGLHSESKWQPCIEKLAEHLRESDPTCQLNTHLITALQNRGFEKIVEIAVEKEMVEKARQTGLKAIVMSDVQQVAFVECSERWTFSVDI